MKKESHTKRNIVIVVLIAAVFVITVVALAGYVFPIYADCSGACPTLPTFSLNAVSCTVSNKTCELVLSNPSNVNLQATGCFWGSFSDSPYHGANVGNGTLRTSTVPPNTSPTVPPNSSITVYCSGYPGTPSVGEAVLPGIWLGGGRSVGFAGTSEGPYVWK